MIGIVYGYFVKHGGVGRYIAECLKRFTRSWEYELITIEKSLGTPKGTRTLIVDCERDARFMSLRENESFSNSVKPALDRYNIVHQHGIYNIIPDIYTAHVCIASYFEKFMEYFGETRLRKHFPDYAELIKLEDKIMRNLSSSKIITVSRKVADEISCKYEKERRKIRIIPGASRLSNNKVVLGGKKCNRNGLCYVGFVGGNLYSKGIYFMLDVLKKLSRRGVRLECVGAGCNDKIRSFLSRGGNYNVNIMGKCDINERFYNKLDIFMNLSVYEGYSLSTLEAMSLGVPVISSILNGVFHDSVRRGFALGKVKDVSDSDEVANMAERIILDGNFRKQIVDTGYRIANLHTWGQAASEYERVYEECL